MTMYIEEEDVWKCPKHPSRRHRTGVCPVCLRDRLIVLCPECANMLPCLCNASGSSSSSSASSSSSFSFFSSSSRDGGGGGGRVSELIDREPAFGRSRSVGIPYIFSRFAGDKAVNQRPEPAIRSKSKIALFLSKFKMMILSRKRGEIEKNDNDSEHSRFDSYGSKHSNKKASVDDFAKVMLKSRSVHLPTATSLCAKSPATVKNGRSFRSPMRFFRHARDDSRS